MVYVTNWQQQDKKELKILVTQSLDSFLIGGEIPCLMSEIGIPYDMDKKKAYADGRYTGQYAAMDATNYALEKAGLSFTLWNYCPDVSYSVECV
jgi:hypothetical protein